MTDVTTPTIDPTPINKAADSAEKTAEQAKDTARDFKLAASEFYEDAKSVVKARAEQAAKEAERLYGVGKTKAQDGLTELEGQVRERPVLAVAAAAAAGFVLGALLNANQPKVIYLRDKR